MIITSEWFSNLSEEHRSYFKAVFHLSGLFDLKVLLGTYVNDALKMDTEAASLYLL
ncbi:putative arylformamidase [Caligus rogercresseyi]|uniref:Putative arylformamidase n=1 Tax=Caligus rogercresseyi TaxID=217165 RepID=A0A7T8KFK2_CALRO|nr:putative arylformamidase [Caligus rogercresseyi]